MPTKIGNVSITLLDSGSDCSIFDKLLETRRVHRNSQAIRVSKMNKPQLRTFSNETIQTKGRIRTPVTINGWLIPVAGITVLADDLTPLMAACFLINLDLQLHNFLLPRISSESYFNKLYNKRIFSITIAWTNNSHRNIWKSCSVQHQLTYKIT